MNDIPAQPLVPINSTAKANEFEQASELRDLGITITRSQEYFAYLVANGTPKWESYKLAYDTTTDKKTTLGANAYKVEQIKGVKEAIAFYKDQVRLAGSSVESYAKEAAFAEIEEVMQWCREKKDARTMVSLIKLKTEIAEVTKMTTEAKKPVTQEQLNAELKQALKGLPLDKVKDLQALLTVVDVAAKPVKR